MLGDGLLGEPQEQPGTFHPQHKADGLNHPLSIEPEPDALGFQWHNGLLNMANSIEACRDGIAANAKPLSICAGIMPAFNLASIIQLHGHTGQDICMACPIGRVGIIDDIIMPEGVGIGIIGMRIPIGIGRMVPSMVPSIIGRIGIMVPSMVGVGRAVIPIDAVAAEHILVPSIIGRVAEYATHIAISSSS